MAWSIVENTNLFQEVFLQSFQLLQKFQVNAHPHYQHYQEYIIVTKSIEWVYYPVINDCVK